MVEETRRAVDLHKPLDSKTKELKSFKPNLAAKESVFKEQSSLKGTLQMQLYAACAEIGCGERVVLDFVKHLCTGYTTLMRAQALRYHDRLHAVLGDV